MAIERSESGHMVGLIYETISEPALWQQIAQDLSRDLDAQSAWMIQPTKFGPAVLTYQGLAEALLQSYSQHFHKVDILIQQAHRQPDAFRTRAFRERDLVSEATWLSSELYTDLARPSGVGQVLATYLGDIRSDKASALSFFRAPDAALFDDATVRHYEQYLPHLQRALRIRRRFEDQLDDVPSWTAALLDQIPAGIFLLDGSGRLIHANVAGARALDARDGIFLRAGMIETVDRGVAARFGAILRNAITGQVSAGEMLIPRLAGKWIGSVCPLTTDQASRFWSSRCRAWLWLTAPHEPAGRLDRRLKALFNLSPAQQRVAAALAAGASPRETSDEFKVAIATVRTQIQSIYSKLGVNRQVDLVTLLTHLASLPPVERPK